ncbi:hypothetical protein GCM10008927_04620 [Amylibacter ulvae]|uniref:Uncharacterized protein n=1 Tax=Paramylibacter ulvae TaxID=1651968 RepID=A0ABQ3CU59_9RHOB|nr:hypothetical protein [Amylibacter ulvae]GHA43094.1 hypothetical protein GCM10008927_04620 [Amylibacter ulvae]
MSEIKDLEARAEAALAKFATAASDKDAGFSDKITALEADLTKANDALEKEERIHAALQEEFLDVCQDFGQMELDVIKTTDAQNAVNGEKDAAIIDASETLAELRRLRQEDIDEVDDILAKLTPIVEG